MKIASLEAMWETEPAPASFNMFAIPDQANEENHFAVEIPYVMGIIGTRSLTEPMLGIKDLVKQAEDRIRSGILAYSALQEVRNDPDNIAARTIFDEHWRDLGYALLLKRYSADVLNATDQEIAEAAQGTVPQVAPLFWTFRVMVGLGVYFILFFAFSFWLASTGRLQKYPLYLKTALWSLPLPWIAIECGWFVAEFGRQPWVIEGVLPTYYAASGLAVSDLLTSLGVFLVIYTVLAIIGVKVMLHSVRSGPQSDAVEKPEAPETLNAAQIASRG